MQGCDSGSDCVQLSDYSEAFFHIKDLFESERWKKIVLGKPWAYTSGATYAVYKLFPSSFIEFKISPIMMMKAVKNEVSIQIVAGKWDVLLQYHSGLFSKTDL